MHLVGAVAQEVLAPTVFAPAQQSNVSAEQVHPSPSPSSLFSRTKDVLAACQPTHPHTLSALPDAATGESRDEKRRGIFEIWQRW